MPSRRKTGNVVKRLNPVAFINTEITKLVSNLKELDLPNFGPDLTSLEGTSLNDAVVSSRIINKFIPKVSQDSNLLHHTAITNMIDHDARGFNFEPRKAPVEVRRVLYSAKCALHDYFSGFKPSYRFRPPTGESAKSNSGLTDVMYKLSDISHWEVSPSALPYAVAICYNNLWLKRLVRSNFRIHNPTGLPWKRQAKEWYLSGMTPYQIFGKMFASLCSLNAVTRVTSIPKNAKSRRVIAMVPFWNMVCQLSLMQDMRDLMFRKLGINLDTLADLHKGLIAHRHYATIDLKNASNSVWQNVVDFHFPGSIRRIFTRLVDKHYEYDDQYGHFNMFSPMGCGLTFDVMTTLLLFLGRQFDSSTSVFGDDILISQGKAPLMLDVLKVIGMQVNHEKSYITGTFSESCGGFYNHTTSEHISCFDFEYAENRVEAFSLVNKLYCLLQRKQISLDLRVILRATHDTILTKLKRFSVCFSNLPHGAIANIESSFLWSDDGNVIGKTIVTDLVSTYYHRVVIPMMRVSIVYKTNPVKDELSTFACFFLRGESYEPNKARCEERFENVDAFSGTPFARVPLMSFT